MRGEKARRHRSAPDPLKWTRAYAPAAPFVSALGLDGTLGSDPALSNPDCGEMVLVRFRLLNCPISFYTRLANERLI